MNISTKPLVFLNDKVAKKILKNEKYGKIFSAKIISSALDLDYQKVYDNLTLSSEEIAFSALTVNSTADAKYYDDTCYFNIEINFYNGDSKKKQLESYVYQLYLGQLHTAKNYHNIKKIIQISIDNYDMFHKNEFMYQAVLMEKKYKIQYSDSIQFIHYNIDYLRKLDYNIIVSGKDRMMKLLYFMVCSDDEVLKSVYQKDDIMKEIVDEAKKIAGIEKMDLYLTDEEMMKQDQEYYYNKGVSHGIEQGIQQGTQKKQQEIVVNMYNKNIPVETIAEYSNITVDEVKKIIKENKG